VTEMATRELTVARDVLHATVVTIGSALGMPEADARILAESLVEADLRGVHTHGVAALTGYARRLRGGGVNPTPRVRVTHTRGAITIVDADHGLGQIGSQFAMERAIEAARASGIGAAAVRNSSHFGAAAFYAAMALPHDMIGFATTSAGNRIAPIGGRTPVVGNNPFAWAIPAATERPIILDMAQSVVAAGKIGMAARKGEKIPFGWAMDGQGRPTDDPLAGAAGLLVPIGGPKGFGLALIVDILCGALSGAALGRELAKPHQPDTPSQIGHFFMAIDVASFTDVASFKARVDGMIRQVHESEPASPGTPLYVPGEIEWRLRERRVSDGIPLLKSIVADLKALADELGLGASIATAT